MYTKTTIKVMEEIRELRGKTVKIFGQDTKLSEEVDKGLVDVLDILEELVYHEVDLSDIFPELEDFEGTPEEELDKLYNLGLIKHEQGDNTYNYNGSISNDLNFNIYSYEYGYRGEVIIELSIHKYGDVRGNYTDSIILHFGDLYEFYELIDQYKNEFIEIDNKEFMLSFRALSEEIEIAKRDTNGWDVFMYSYGCYSDAIEDLKSKLS